MSWCFQPFHSQFTHIQAAGGLRCVNDGAFPMVARRPKARSTVASSVWKKRGQPKRRTSSESG